jgi:hypothetical protein
MHSHYRFHPQDIFRQMKAATVFHLATNILAGRRNPRLKRDDWGL